MTDQNKSVSEQANSGASFADVVIDLREYASNPGYSHADYADTMLQAANCIESMRSMFYSYAKVVAPKVPAAAMVGTGKAPAAEQTATTASASIGDDPEFQGFIAKLVNEEYRSYVEFMNDFIAFIDSRAQAPSQDAPAVQAACARCSGHEIIYFEDAQRPCPDCQDLSDYDDDAAPAAQDDEPERLDEALANFLAEHTRLSQDGIDTQAMRMSLALNYAALLPVPDEDIAEWREQGYLDDEPAAQAVERAAPGGFVPMPKALTAENGAKSIFLSEFNEEITVECPECNGDEECGECAGYGYITQKVAIGWDTIKEIYATAVKHLAAAPAAPAVEPMDMPLPCDIKVGAVTIRKGCTLRTLKTRMESLHRMAMKYSPKPAPEALAMVNAMIAGTWVDEPDNPNPAGTEPTQAARDVLADDAKRPDFLKWWTSIETGRRKSMLADAYADFDQIHALMRMAFEAAVAAMSAEIERIDRASEIGGAA